MRRQRSQRRRHQRNSIWVTIAEMEVLEPRTLPAGTVTVAVAGGNVTITGDDNNNSIKLAFSTEVGVFIVADGGTKVKGAVVAGGLANEFLILNTTEHIAGNLKILMKGGDDDVEIVVGAYGDATLQIDKNLTFDMGDGDDTLNLTIDNGDCSMVVKGTAQVTTGEGVDEVNLESYGPVTFEKTLTIDTGSDEDTVELNCGADLTVKGAVTIKTGGDVDHMTISGNAMIFDFLKGLTVSTGAGADFVGLTDSDEGGGPPAFFIGGNLGIDTAGGSDEINLRGSSFFISGAVIITTGDGSDEFNFEDNFPSEIDGDVKITTANGSDSVLLSADGDLTIKGHVDVNTGNGSDHVGVFADAMLTIEKNLKITTGAQSDDVAVLTSGDGSLEIGGAFDTKLDGDEDSFAAGAFTTIQDTLDGGFGGSEGVFTVTGDLKVSGGIGDDVLLLIDIDTSGNLILDGGEGSDDILSAYIGIIKDWKVLTGNGNDRLVLRETETTGKTTIDMGAGNDETTISFLNPGHDVSVKMGAGDDNLSIDAILSAGIVDGVTPKFVFDGGAHSTKDNFVTDDSVEDADINFEGHNFDVDTVFDSVRDEVLARFPFFDDDE